MSALDRANWPADCREHSCVAGIFVGGCVARGEGSRFRAKAHAHWSGPFAGWISVLAARRLSCRELILHEIAHLIAPGGHHDKWRRALLAIGGTLDAVPGVLRSYRKRSR